MDPMNQPQSSYDIPSADDVAGKPARKRKPSPKKAAAPAEPKAAKSTKAKGPKKPRKPYTPSPTSKRALMRPLKAMEKELQTKLKAIQTQIARMEKLEF
jgi:hypothetical protein